MSYSVPSTILARNVLDKSHGWFILLSLLRCKDNAKEHITALMTPNMIVVVYKGYTMCDGHFHEC